MQRPRLAHDRLVLEGRDRAGEVGGVPQAWVAAPGGFRALAPGVEVKRTWPSSVLDGYAKATKVTCPGFAEVRLAMATKKASSNW
jgi:hypothetical protein